MLGPSLARLLDLGADPAVRRSADRRRTSDTISETEPQLGNSSRSASSEVAKSVLPEGVLVFDRRLLAEAAG